MATSKTPPSKPSVPSAAELETPPPGSTPPADTLTKPVDDDQTIGEVIDTVVYRDIPGTAGADKIVRRWSRWAAGFGLIPIPLVDVATTTGFSIKMLHSLAGYYGVRFRSDVGKSVITSLLGGLAAPAAGLGLASLLKGIPVIGLPLAVISTPATNYAVTFAVGRVFTAHFGTGGTLFDFDPEQFRDYFREQFEEAKDAFTGDDAAKLREKAA